MMQGLQPFLPQTQYSSHRQRQLLPSGSLGEQLFSTGSREPVILGPLSLIRQLPFGRDPALRLESMKCRIQRTRFNLQHVQRRTANLLADGMTMKGTEEEDPKNEKVQGSLKEINAVAASHHRLWRHAT
jgi:hypothetical protein